MKRKNHEAKAIYHTLVDKLIEHQYLESYNPSNWSIDIVIEVWQHNIVLALINSVTTKYKLIKQGQYGNIVSYGITDIMS